MASTADVTLEAVCPWTVAQEDDWRFAALFGCIGGHRVALSKVGRCVYRNLQINHHDYFVSLHLCVKCFADLSILVYRFTLL